MNKSIVFLCAAMISMSTWAQFSGVPVANSAVSPLAGETRISAGAVVGDDFNLYGGRLSFSPLGRLALFADLGAIDPDRGDTGIATQMGGTFTLPIQQSPVDMALRALWSNARYDAKAGDYKANGFNFGILTSREVGGFAPYVFVGLNFLDVEVKSGGNKSSKDETDLALALGVLLNLTGHFGLYAEFAYVDDSLMGFGARWQF